MFNVKHGKRLYKQMAFEVGVRNPERYINKFDTYYFMCSKGHTSSSVSKILNALGYNTYSITGGIEKLFN